MAQKNPKAKNVKTTGKKDTKKNLSKVSKKQTKKVKNTKKQTAGAAEKPKQKKRYFKVIYKLNGNYVCEGRYSGKKPKQAACKALTTITNGMKKRGEKYLGKLIKYSVIEQTRGSARKKYYYEGKKYTLKKPVTVTITKNKDSSKEVEQKIVYKSGSDVKKCLIDKCPKELVDFTPTREVLDADDEEEVQAGGKKNTKKTKPAKKNTKNTKAKPAKKTKTAKKPAKKVTKKPAKQSKKNTKKTAAAAK